MGSFLEVQHAHLQLSDFFGLCETFPPEPFDNDDTQQKCSPEKPALRRGDASIAEVVANNLPSGPYLTLCQNSAMF